MKIKVHSGKKRINLWVPLSLVKSRFIFRLLKKSNGSSKDVTELPADGAEAAQQNEITVSKTDADGNKVVKKKGGKAKMSFDLSDVPHSLLVTVYKNLKDVVRSQGHFNLVDVDSSDGTKVKITI